MTFVKRLVMQGFKSFVKKTEIPFTPEINVVLGPNGSGKSNIMDALCFVLGRLSIKSMRAAKAKNLIFMGSKAASPSKEAMVEIVFDNTNKEFSIEGHEVSVKRIVRKNGQSIYKINNHVKTRSEVLSLLAQAGIDPYGFNIILQGEIQNFVRVHTEERRKIIEEVSGISIYELRKQKSLKELDKTEERLKEISAILKERTAYLNNLEKERQQALRYKKLEKDIKKLKASILTSDKNKNLKEISRIDLEIEKKNKEIEKVKKQMIGIETIVRNCESHIVSINSTIQKSTGLEQEKLNREITNIRAELAGTNVNIENNEKKLSQLKKQKLDLNETIKENEETIAKIKKEFGAKKPVKSNKEQNLTAKQRHLDTLEEQRKRFYMVRSELKSLRVKIHEKNIEFQNYTSESEFLVDQIRSLAREIFDKNTTSAKIDGLKISLAEQKQLLNDLRQKEIELEKISYNNEYEIERQKKLVDKISQMDICPLCKSKITEEHLEGIEDEISPRIDTLKKQVEKSDKDIGDIYKKKEILELEIENLTHEINNRESDVIKISNVNEKEKQLKILREKTNSTEVEIFDSDKKIKEFEKKLEQNSDIEQKYEILRLEIQEMSVIDEEDLDSEILFRKRELERSKISFKQFSREYLEIEEELIQLNKTRKDKQKQLEVKNRQEEELSEKFKKLISQRDDLGKKIRDEEIVISQKQNEIHNIEDKINNFKIEKARVGAIIENLESELIEFANIELIKIPREKLVQRLVKTQEIFSNIGSVNMRSLEVYDEIKKEYESVQSKVDIIGKEKESILKIIHQIDIKKKKTFLKTLTALNEIFSRNFAQLNTKGQVYLELENKKDPFEGGVNIVVKTGHGKYFDVTSLSGGEQTIVALSLIFAIQELNPYAFYVLDEIDAALDKRNSERLANLLKKYMAKGQYIIISHNDEVISEASVLYGISMHDGISKIISLKI
jgi:chromosome segregation protein